MLKVIAAALAAVLLLLQAEARSAPEDRAQGRRLRAAMKPT
jgi:hypothetical protein